MPAKKQKWENEKNIMTACYLTSILSEALCVAGDCLSLYFDANACLSFSRAGAAVIYEVQCAVRLMQ